MLTTLITIDICILVYFILLVMFHVLLTIKTFPLVKAFFITTKSTNAYGILDSRCLPPVSVIIPIYNEGINAVEAIKSVLRSTYDNLQVIVVNDGSTDVSTMEMLNEHFAFHRVEVPVSNDLDTATIKNVYTSKKYKQLMIIDKEYYGIGSGDACNAGINYSSSPYFITFDADSIMEPNMIKEMMYRMVERSHVIAVGGAVYILNNCTYKNGKMLSSRFPRRFITASNAVEHLRSHIFGRTLWNNLGGSMTYSGTCTMLEKKAAINAGGFDANNYSQDAEIIMRLHAYMSKHKYPYIMTFTPAAIAWTDSPSTLLQYIKQRNHWQRGLCRSTFRYFYMFLNPRYGIRGLVGFPSSILFDTFSPLVEFLAYTMAVISFLIGLFSWQVTLLFFIIAWGFSAVLNLANAVVSYITFSKYEKFGANIFRTVMLSTIEMFGFRQIRAATCTVAVVHYMLRRVLGKEL